MEHSLDLASREAGLRFWFSRHSSVAMQRALAVDVDRAALEDERRAVAVGALRSRRPWRQRGRPVPGEVQPAVEAAPGVEAPIDPAPPAPAVDDERRADVADPGVVGRHLDHRAPRSGSSVAGVVELGGRDRHRDRLARARSPGDGRRTRACAGFAPSRQLSGRSGQAIQVPAWGSNSPGIRKPSASGVGGKRVAHRSRLGGDSRSRPDRRPSRLDGARPDAPSIDATTDAPPPRRPRSRPRRSRAEGRCSDHSTGTSGGPEEQDERRDDRAGRQDHGGPHPDAPPGTRNGRGSRPGPWAPQHGSPPGTAAGRAAGRSPRRRRRSRRRGCPGSR